MFPVPFRLCSDLGKFIDLQLITLSHSSICNRLFIILFFAFIFNPPLVFCYGATGAGKTYTMLGTPTNPGIMGLTIQDLFDRIDEIGDKGYKFNVTVSYLEVYNEMIRDLLNPSTEVK